MENTVSYEEVENVLKKIRPALEEHHGDLKLIEIRGNTVYLQFEGGCSDCPVVDMSLKNLIEITIRGNLPWVHKVEILYPKITLS